MFKKVSLYQISGLKSNIKSLYEGVNDYHSNISPRQYVYNPNNILGSGSGCSSPPIIDEFQLDGPASIKKALQHDFNNSTQPGNFTSRQLNKLNTLPLAKLNQTTNGFTIKLQNTDRGRDEECYVDDSPRPSQSASNFDMILQDEMDINKIERIENKKISASKGAPQKVKIPKIKIESNGI